jgi:NAD(P)-dependent dehydrogenase (short-subunit alcohol dehydrogenase family)
MAHGNRLEGRVALVTGAASGIGRAIAKRFVGEAANVVAGDIDEAGLEAVAEECGDSLATMRCDVTDEVQQEALAAFAVDRFGRLDVVVANAGAGFASLIVEHPLEEWRRVLDLCLTGVFLTLKHAGGVLVERGGGSIVTTASLNAIQPGRGMGAYCSAKAGVAMLTEVAALEMGPKGVRVNAIAPGLVMTAATSPLNDLPGVVDEYVENTPLGRYADPDEIAEVALFLASDASGFMNGSLVSVDGGARTRRYPDVIAGIDRLMAGG